MNNINPLTSCLLFIFCMIGYSCTEDFEELNTDPNRIDRITPGTLLNPILYELASFNTKRSDNFTFDLMQVALPFPSASGGVHRYDIGDEAGSSTWNAYYRWLINIKEMREAARLAGDPNYEAIALTLNAWTYSLLTDTFGDVPLEEASMGDEKVFQPTFNTQKEIYTQILEDLESANTLFDASVDMIYGTDILYGNDVSKWQKFCNSLHLRLLLRVSKREEMGAFTKMARIINNPADYPVFANNEEAAILKITGIEPNVSPWGRAIDFTSFRAAGEFFVDNLNQLEDPRREVFITQARQSDGTSAIGYRGIPSGYAGSDSQFDFLPSNVNRSLVEAPMVSVIMTYAEVEFIKAELALQGVIDADAEAHYKNGVRASIEQWLIAAAPGFEWNDTYFDNPFAAFDGTLEKIMLQKYYALYFNDYQQWFEYRRTGLPVLPKTEGMLNNQNIPVRLKYPSSVQTHNGSNYAKAVSSMGGDDINTKVWWEKD